MNCPPPIDTWRLARTALVLDPGLPEDGVKKSRSYLMNLRAAAMMPTEESEEESEEGDEELEELEPDEESDTEEIGHSEPSQLSYRLYSVLSSFTSVLCKSNISFHVLSWFAFNL